MPHRRAPEIDGQYLMGCVVEEAGEVIQIGGKILRHGWCSFSPFDPDRVPNRQLFAQEAGDLIGAILFLGQQGHIDLEIVNQFSEARLAKLADICPIDERAPIEAEEFDIRLPEGSVSIRSAH